MKLLYLPVLMLMHLVAMISIADPIDNVAELIRQGKIHELASHFAASVDITLADNENVYSNIQAELIIDKFFNENKLRSVTILHKISSNASYRFGVLIINTDKGIYRLAYTLKQTGGNFMLFEMRIEKEKVK